MENEDLEVDIAAEFGVDRVEGQRFAIYIPDKDKDGKGIDQEKWLDRALRLLSEIGGGATAMPPVRGAWLNEETGTLIIEEPVVVYSFVKPVEFAKRLQDLNAFMNEMGRETNQGEIAFEFDGVLYLKRDFSSN